MKKILIPLVTVILGLAAPLSHGQGTIQFLNSALSKIKYLDDACAPLTDAPVGAVVGVFYGVTPDSLTLAGTTARITAPGLFNGGTVFALSGVNPGQTISLKIAGWYTKGGVTPERAPQGPFSAGITHYGESAVVTTTALGPEAGPGTVVMQSANGTNPNRVKPFTILQPELCPEPSTWALLGFGAGALLLQRRHHFFPRRRTAPKAPFSF